MDEPRRTLTLWDYRRRVASLYERVRVEGPGEAAWRHWVTTRDELFANHPQSALPAESRSTFTGLTYYPYDPAHRVHGEVVASPAAVHTVGHSGHGSTPFRAFGTVEFTLLGAELRLTLLWLENYGGGVFLPFRDSTNGSTTYGGGRYLLDTSKGADLGHRRSRITLDFNYAYHPSCVHDSTWSCPLAPPQNRLDLAVEAGERLGG